jgi:hypothetical protein
MKRTIVAGTALALGAVALTGCDDINTIMRPSAPVVLTGAQLPDLVGEAPGDIVAFAHTTLGDTRTWTQIPVQVDERRLVDWGSQPANNTTPGVDGTVYGTAATGRTALQYTDPGTFVGPDTNAAFDADDELVFMLEDAGGRQRPGEESEPPGVVAGSGVRVQLDDTTAPAGDRQAWVYLFVTDGSLDPAAGRDYVDYTFSLTSGAYKTTYRRADGPNPETSTVVTDAYRIEYPDRWYETSWRIDAGTATGVDILDANRNLFAIGNCGRSNATFADAEGAFIANIDGPVRGIRSYVGANSGPLTQRTHLMYRTREDIVTDLRVHSIPAVMDFVDFSAAASGMTYRSSTVPGGVTVDGVPDAVGTARPTWESIQGPQGVVLQAVRQSTDIPNFDAGVQWFYRDLLSPADSQCWGDANAYGQSGAWVTVGVPNTDPRSIPFAIAQTRRHVQFQGPPVYETVAEQAAAFASAIDTPLVVTATVHDP